MVQRSWRSRDPANNKLSPTVYSLLRPPDSEQVAKSPHLGTKKVPMQRLDCTGYGPSASLT